MGQDEGSRLTVPCLLDAWGWRTSLRCRRHSHRTQTSLTQVSTHHPPVPPPVPPQPAGAFWIRSSTLRNSSHLPPGFILLSILPSAHGQLRVSSPSGLEEEDHWLFSYPSPLRLLLKTSVVPGVHVGCSPFSVRGRFLVS